MDTKTKTEDLGREYRRKVAEVRKAPGPSWEKKERRVRELGLRYVQERRQAQRRHS